MLKARNIFSKVILVPLNLEIVSYLQYWQMFSWVGGRGEAGCGEASIKGGGQILHGEGEQ